METLGLNLSEGKALLAGVQDLVVAQQVQGASGAMSCVPTLPRHTPARIPAAHSSVLYSVASKCRIRAGTAAPARQMDQTRFVR
jgi:hypothetical protein